MEEATVVVLRVCACASTDRLLVEGEVNGAPITARGWRSATLQHFEASAYGPDGHRLPGAEPRAMTRDEVLEYARGLLRIEAGAAAATPEDLEISDLPAAS